MADDDHDTTDGEKIFKCETCGLCFARKDILDKHVTTHLCQKPFKCGECGKTFTRKFDLTVHVKSVHKPENAKTFECELCSEIFPSKYYLRVHMAEHEGENPFICDTCGKSFVLKSTLAEHIKTVHLDPKRKRFKCDQCDKAFTRRQYLSVHIKSGHKSDSKCHICYKEFKYKTHLSLHIKKHAKPECPLCFQPTEECACSWNPVDDSCDRLRNRFARENLMIRCVTCSKPILRPSQLKMHMRIHRDYKCILCNEDYKSCSCCDDYLEVSKATNTYQKSNKTSKQPPPVPKNGELFSQTDEPAIKEEEEQQDEPVEIDKAMVVEDVKCTICNEDYKNCVCSDDFMEVTKSTNTYQKTNRKTNVEPVVVKEEINVKDEEKSMEICDDNCNESCSYLEVKKSIKTYQRTNKSSVNCKTFAVEVKEEKEEEVETLVPKFEETKEINVLKEEPKEECTVDGIAESFVESVAEIDEVKEEESIKL